MATVAALAMIPLLIAAGAGIDLSRTLTARRACRTRSDATALALAHLPTGTTQEVLKTKGQQWMTANMLNKNVSS